MNGNAHHGDGDSPDGVRPRRKAPAAPRRIGWRAANRIVSGRDGGPGAEDLRTLIAVASMPTSSPSTPASSASFASGNRVHADAESADREAMLAAYRESAAAWEPDAGRRQARSGKTARRAAPGRHTSRALVLRFASAVLLVCGVGAAAASAGVLPAGVQRIARDYFGIGGVSKPSTHVPSSSTVITGPPKGGSGGGDGGTVTAPSTAAGSAAPASSDAIVALCQKIAQGKGHWKSDVDAAGQATLITAAGDEHKVKRYCTRLLAAGGASPTPSPAATDTKGSAATGKPSPEPSTEPTESHGKVHASRSPEAHGAG